MAWGAGTVGARRVRATQSCDATERQARRMGAAAAWVCLRLAPILAIFVAAAPAAAQESWNAGTASWFTGSNWTPAGPPGAATTVTVGNGGTANIGAAGALSSNATIDNSSAIHVLSGGSWTDSGTSLGFNLGGGAIIVGESGIGALNIDNGGTVTTTGSPAGTVLIADQATSTGTITLGNGGVGTASLANNGPSGFPGNFFVGYGGAGTLNVNAGGSVTGFFNMTLGELANSQGSLTVNAGSVNATPGPLIVGDSGVGTALVEGGGSITSGSVAIGNGAGSGGSSATVTGAGSTWNAGNGLSIGVGGNGSLTISNHGLVNVNSGAQINVGDTNGGASGAGALTVDGATLSGAGAELDVGVLGTAASTVLVENGGQLTATAGASIGGATFAYASTGSITVTGAGSSWNGGTGLVDIENPGTTIGLTISNGGSVTNGEIFIGLIDPTAGSNGVLVTGAGSTWNTGVILIGNVQDQGAGAGTGTLSVMSGGHVAATGNVDIGYSPDGGGGFTDKIAVDGAGSQMTTIANLRVGFFGTGDLFISNGAKVSDVEGDIAFSSTNAAGSNVQFGAATAPTNSIGSAVVTGAGSLWQNSGNLLVGDNSTAFGAGYGAGTATGSLSILAGGQVTDVTGYIGFNTGATGSVIVDGAGSAWVNAGNIVVGNSGVGVLTVADGATVSANSGAGIVVVAANAASTGTLNIGAAKGQSAVAPGAILAAEVLFGAGTGNIVFNHTSANYVFSAAIDGAGALDVESGMTALTAASAYTGATTINGGILEVDGAIAGTSSVTVNSGGTLAGAGAVGVGVTINAGATLAPGMPSAPGASLTINGDVAFKPGATYAIYLDPSNATFARINGAASLAGMVSASFAPSSYVSRQYTILTATGGLGGSTFAGLTNVNAANLPAGASDFLSYDANDVYLNLAAGFSGFPGLSGNQQGVAKALTNSFSSGAIPFAFFSLSPGGLTQVDGEAATGADHGAFQFGNAFLSLMLDPYADNRGGPGTGGAFGPALGYADATPPTIASAFSALDKGAAQASAPAQPRWNMWGAAFGGGQQISGAAAVGSHNTSSGAAGFAAGADYHVSPDAMLGFALAGGGTSWSLADSLGGGSSSVFQAGAYGAQSFGAAYVSGALAAGDYWVTTHRTVTLPGGDTFGAHFNALGYGGRLESGYRLSLAPLALTPYGALQAQAFRTPSFGETAAGGATLFALNYNAQTATDTRLELGAWVDTSFAYADGNALKLFGRLAWAHDWQTNPELTATFLSLPTASFVVNGARQAPDLALVTAGLEWRLARNWTLSAKFDGEFGKGSQTYGATGKIGYSW